jgi:ADP-heptose:LPS heptosyltransferase
VWRNLRLLEFLGIPPQGDYLEFPLREEDWQELSRVPGAGALRPGEYVCVHPGANDQSRRWPAEHFARVADSLAAQGLQVALTGTAAESGLAGEVASSMRFPATNLAGHTGLGALAALISRARLLVSNDTGASHLAAALHVPSVVIFTASDPLRWAPLDRERHRTLGPSVPVPSGPGLQSPEVYSARPVTVEAVLAEAEQLLSAEAGYAA